MNKFFSNKKLIVLMVTVILTFGLIAISINIRDKKNTPPLIQQIGNDSVGLIGSVLTAPINGINQIGDNASNLFDTYNENKRLKSKLQSYSQDKVQLDTVKSENKDLKKQLELNDTLTDYTKITASVITRSPSDWQSYLTINRGSNNGIKKNMPVMSGSGLVGRISEVNKTNSKVELISSQNSLSNRFAAEIQSDSVDVNGVISSYNADSGVLIMSQVNSIKDVKPGQKVITSGLGGITPRGLYIGKVINVKKDEYGLSNVIYLKPATNLTNFTIVTAIDRSVGEG
ncbi:cell shape-determining protein MreC [Companilactobacillus sp. RD055328]|uniref:rod shape-determining protein MreC n=1 Tax=Companilactobacillus sp. RD055328 TaxID=2916634 RepID=UPI001FC85F12|nr:rod shape-determining protein MreC [Companilactobacillus sp. RD055328]GKQ42858.1 cell shape-determining protein MreC [Companilactobacillus sp. RD055328]